MPDPNTEHGLRVQLATALRERDTARNERDMFQFCVANEKENAAKEREARDAEWRAVVKADREAIDALRAEVQRLERALQAIANECMAQTDNFARCDQTAHQIARAALATGGDRG